MEKIIELENNDDITSIRSRIDFVLPELARAAVQNGENGKRPRLLVIVPRKNQALQSLVNMKLLARTVHNRAIEVALVSRSPKVRDFAREAGFKVYGSKWLARRAGWVTGQAAVAAPETTLPPVKTADPVQPAPRVRKRRKKKKYVVVSGDKRSHWLKFSIQQIGLLLLIVLAALGLVMGALLLLPEATVTITPLAQPVEAELVVKGDPDAESVDFETLTFPARREQVELSLFGEIDTVKTELNEVEKARGTVVFINRTDQEVLVPISTTLSTSAGEPVEFLTVISATVPPGEGASSEAIPVIAVEPGPSGNMRTGQLNRVLDSALGVAVRVINEQPIGGGALAPAKIVTEDDKPRLQAHLRQLIQQEGLAQLQASLGEQEFIPPESVEVIVLDVKYREFSGDFSDVFGGEMQAVVRSTVIGGYNANRLALAALNAQVPPGYELDIEGLQFGAGEVVDTTGGVATFIIKASGQAVPVIEPTDVANQIASLSIGDAQALLSQQYDLVTVPGVDLKPDWLVDLLGRLPFSPLRINVIVNDAVSPPADGE
ncbi:MAG: hypothetical protein Kow0031_25980 [Anaerolineae bacterium]